ncbi:hypothetical protein CEXT_507651 [Caerostris extrusa]|uniref:Uncharacterized protein n=1 Tax=Caerostris extrusa TaxID=172846 RepID=A0AAV4TPS1_CAEEX|nr:hypothetical protein CEXT_507651 [Caerostris extrusa]
MPSENASRLEFPIANDFHRFLGPKEINRSMKDSWILQKRQAVGSQHPVRFPISYSKHAAVWNLQGIGRWVWMCLIKSRL